MHIFLLTCFQCCIECDHKNLLNDGELHLKNSALTTLLYFGTNRIRMCTLRAVVQFGCNLLREMWASCCWAFMIFVKQHLGRQQLHSNEEVEVAGCKWLWMQDPGLCHSRNFELIARWNKCIVVLGGYVQNWRYFIASCELHVMF